MMQMHQLIRSLRRRGVGSAMVLAFALYWPAVAAAQPPAAAPAATTAASPALFDEPRVLAEGISWIEKLGNDDQGRPSEGFYPDFGNMITGAGWISIGPGYRQRLWGDRATFDASAALSWRAYKTAQTRVEFPRLGRDRLTLGSQLQWLDFTQVRYFGVGPDSLEAGATDYRVQATDVTAYANWELRESVQASGGVGILSRPSLSSSTGPFDRDESDTLTVYADEAGVDSARQPRYIHGDASLAMDTRDHPSYPRRGGLYRAGWTIYRDRGDGTRSFNRWEIEAAQFVPVARERGVLAFHWWTVLSDVAADAEVPFYLLPSLGGHNTLRGFADYRFHDRQLLAVNVESRWALWPHMDAAVFFDAGNVAHRVRDLDVARTSAGAGVRVHTGKTTLARFDIAHGAEGWRFLLKLTDSLRFGRLSRRTAALPFVP